MKIEKAPPRIRTYRNARDGFYAMIYYADGGRECVMSPEPHGFRTRGDARAGARQRIETGA